MKKLIYLLALVIMVNGCATTSQPQSVEDNVKLFVRGGLIGKIDVAANTVWVNENMWYALNVDRKRSFIDIISRYFKKQRGYERVIVLGWHTGRKLAKTGIMGVKFY